MATNEELIRPSDFIFTITYKSCYVRHYADFCSYQASVLGLTWVDRFLPHTWSYRTNTYGHSTETGFKFKLQGLDPTTLWLKLAQT